MIKNNPKDKLVDGKVLKHVLLLLKGYIDAGSSGEACAPITVYNTPSEEVKELVYDIVYGREEGKPDDEEIIGTDVPLASYLLRYINSRIGETSDEEFVIPDGSIGEIKLDEELRGKLALLEEAAEELRKI